MPISCNPQDLASASSEFCCVTLNPPVSQAIRLYLLRHIAGLDSMTPEQLLSAATCFLSCVPEGAQKAVESYLLCQIASNGGSSPVGGGGNLLLGPTPITVVDSFNSPNEAISLAIQTAFNGLIPTEMTWFVPTSVTNNLNFSTDVNTTLLSFPNLLSVGGNANFNTCTALTTLGLASLQTVGGSATFNGCTALPSLAFPALTSVGLALEINGDTSLASLSLPVLVSTGDQLVVSQSNLTSFSLPAFSSCGNNFDFFQNTLLASVSFPSLTTISGRFAGNDNPALLSVSLPALTTVAADFFLNACPSLASFSAPNWVPANGTSIAFSGDALDAASVNHILARCVAAGVTTCTIDLSAGTNAAPTGQGIIDSAALTTAGNTVTTN